MSNPSANASAQTSGGQFTTTRWSVVLMAGQNVSSESAAALERLCGAYWRPICYFAQRKGWPEADAKDLTQQFFARLLARNDFRRVDPEKGKFRTFLLSAFTNFLTNEYHRNQTLKRGGGQLVSLDEFPDGGLALATAAAPDKVYDAGWAATILQLALRRLKEEMAAAGRAGQFDALKRFLTENGAAPDYAAAVAGLGVEASSVPVLVHRLRLKYRELVREEVAQTVTSPIDLEEEMRHLFDVINQ
jgi:DNA-directed RNA polymerase specialized sigma24 family protein